VPATVTVRYWAGAQRAAGVERESLTAASVGDLRAQLAARRDLARIAAVASFLVDGVQADDDTALHDGVEVDVLPPFAGGGVERLTAVVSGRVQGVGLRYWVRREAESLGLTGSATNLMDGRVEIVVEGPREVCETLLAALNSHATPGAVHDVFVSWSAATGDAKRFVVG
jgi:acylphosphatase